MNFEVVMHDLACPLSDGTLHHGAIEFRQLVLIGKSFTIPKPSCNCNFDRRLQCAMEQPLDYFKHNERATAKPQRDFTEADIPASDDEDTTAIRLALDLPGPYEVKEGPPPGWYECSEGYAHPVGQICTGQCVLRD